MFWWEGGECCFFVMFYLNGELGGYYFIWGVIVGMFCNLYCFLVVG